MPFDGSHLGTSLPSVETVGVVIPVFRSAFDQLKILVDGCATVIEGLGFRCEIVLVFDCGTSEASMAVDRLTGAGGVRVLRLERNVGQQAAVFAGLKSVQSDICITVDEDGSHLAPTIPLLLETMRVSGAGMVLGIMDKPKMSIFRQIGTRSMVGLGFIVFGRKAPRNWSTFRAISRSTLGRLPPKWPTGAVLGFELFRHSCSVVEVPIPVEELRDLRFSSSYTPWKRIRYWLGALRYYGGLEIRSKCVERSS